jgi:hypothetical protein
VATPFERRPIGTELALCQRYYQVIDGRAGGYIASGATITYRIPFRTLMRTTPTVVVTGQENTNTTGATMEAEGYGHANHVALGAGGRLSDKGHRLFLRRTVTLA